MIATRRSPIAVDFGEHHVRVLQLEQRGERLTVRAAHDEPVAAGDAADRRARLAAAAKRALRGHGFRGRHAVVALRLTDVAMRHIRVPTDQLERAGEIIGKQVQEHDTSGQTLSICPIPVADLFDEGERKREFLCCVAAADRVDELIATVEAAGLVPVSIDLAPCAQVRTFTRQASGEPFILLDIGTADARVTVVHDATPVLMRSAPVGGAQLLAAVRQSLELDVDALADLDSRPPSERRPLHDAVACALAEPLEPVLHLIADGMRYSAALFRGRAAASLRVSGAAASLPGLVAYVAQRLGITTELGDPFAGIHVRGSFAKSRRQRAGFATALGLALRGVA